MKDIDGNKPDIVGEIINLVDPLPDGFVDPVKFAPRIVLFTPWVCDGSDRLGMLPMPVTNKFPTCFCVGEHDCHDRRAVRYNSKQRIQKRRKDRRRSLMLGHYGILKGRS